MKKICLKCECDLSIDDFNIKTGTKDGRQPWCRKCQSQQARSHYERNTDYYLKKANRHRHHQRDWWRQFKTTLKCNRCDETHPSCLDFHHSDPTQKEASVASLINRWSRKKIIEEIEKCEIMCSNCHRKHHWRVDEIG